MSLISVILPVYNGEKYIFDAVNSILTQTFSDFELILINDGSTDRTNTILDIFSDKRIIRVENLFNQGLIWSLNRGISTAKGKYLARMDADDCSMPDRLERQVNILEEHAEIGVLGTQVVFLDEAMEQVVWQENYPLTHATIAWRLLFSNSIAHPSVMMRNSLFEQNLGYNSDYRHAEDYKLWTQLIRSTRFANLSDSLLLYRRHEKTVSQQNNALQRAITYRIRQEYIKDIIDIDAPLSLLGQIDQTYPFDNGLTHEQIRNCVDFLLRAYLAFGNKGLLNEEDSSVIYADLIKRITQLRAPPEIVSREIAVLREPTKDELRVKLLELMPKTFVKIFRFLKKHHLVPRYLIKKMY